MARETFDVNTPIQRIQTDLTLEYGVHIAIKRDDLIHPFVSGNKWRKLKYNVVDARKKGRNHIITAGGAYSNHLLATAFAGATLGLQTTGIVRGEELQKNSNHILKLCDQMGMELKFVRREAYKQAEKLATELYPSAFFIPQGGANELGVQGCTEILDEKCLDYTKIVVASGTGTTALGIGHSTGPHQKLHVIDCVGFDPEVYQRLVQELPQKNWEFYKEYSFGGFGRFDEQLIEFSKTFSSQTGILLDPIYTSKMMFAVYDFIRSGYITPKDKVLCIHTGGMTGILSPRWLETG
jgi:1-aminocyclopropane-1-carboxylate deaminase